MEFERRKRIFVPILNRHAWLPTAEDVIVQKVRWGRSKDLDDVRDVIAVQGIETLDMGYVRNWCEAHRTTDRLQAILIDLEDL